MATKIAFPPGTAGCKRFQRQPTEMRMPRTKYAAVSVRASLKSNSTCTAGLKYLFRTSLQLGLPKRKCSSLCIVSSSTLSIPSALSQQDTRRSHASHRAGSTLELCWNLRKASDQSVLNVSFGLASRELVESLRLVGRLTSRPGCMKRKPQGEPGAVSVGGKNSI